MDEIPYDTSEKKVNQALKLFNDQICFFLSSRGEKCKYEGGQVVALSTQGTLAGYAQYSISLQPPEASTDLVERC